MSEQTLQISRNVSIAIDEIRIVPIRASGPGGQNVNKVSSAVHLRFDVPASSLPDFYKRRLLKLNDRRISSEGVIVIKAGRYRTRQKNRADALERLAELIRESGRTKKPRRATKPGKAANRRRLDGKAKRAKTKQLRGRVRDYD